VTVLLGDTTLPPGPIAGGSVTTASSCSAVLAACERIRERLLHAVDPGDGGGKVALTGGRIVTSVGTSEAVETVFDRLGVNAIEEYAEWAHPSMPSGAVKALHEGSTRIAGGPMKDSIAAAFGAEFVEVRVHALTREIRVPRMVGAFAAGHIVNPRTARSQYLGGMIWGISSALHESTEIDRRRGRYINDNLADYLVPVNADVDRVEIILIPEADDRVNPAGIKGIGELANVGTAAAVSNAVYHATGVRIRKLPIRIESLLAA
jgi:xanthine dehydrogenase YagR molybdenum-binding subunit